MWTELCLAYEGPSNTRDTKIAALRLKFNAFKALKGEKVNGTYTRLKCLLNDLKNNGASSSKALISNIHSQDSDSDVEEDNRTNNEFMAKLNAEYHERALLANQKRFYKRCGSVRSTRKPMDKSKETRFTCGKPGHFLKVYPSNKTSTPLYPSSNISFNKSKPYTPLFTSNISQNSSNHQKDYKGKYKGLKAEMAVLSQRIDELTKRKNNKGKGDKGKSDKGLVAESFDLDDESVSLEDEWNIKFKAFMEIAEDEPSIGKGDIEGYSSVNCNGFTFTKVAYVNGLKHNLISISQLCDANFKVLFTKTEGSILNEKDKVVLIASRRRDVYVIDMSSYNTDSNACFYAKASATCEKGKQHRATFTTKRQTENLNDTKVKQLRSDNGTEFKNHTLEAFCDEKGILQNFSSPCTPEQNGVTERRNITLIEAAKTMLNKSQKRVKDSTHHKEKMLLCKQAEKGVPLQAEQYDWLADTDEEIDEQELEAHYSYMAKI
nr:retrovirus-related Pol polyprotein from transposon TNT 1-94 [Tanacetum cinerariifolium]